jgi:hypothetical protein
MHMEWYESRTCCVCRAQLRKRWFWQTTHRLVGADGVGRDVNYIDEERAGTLLATHVLACGDCYANRLGDVEAQVARPERIAP